MITIENVISTVSKNTGVDKELVSKICKHPFMQAVIAMKDDAEVKDILFNGLFRFKLKSRYKNNKNKEYAAV